MTTSKALNAVFVPCGLIGLFVAVVIGPFFRKVLTDCGLDKQTVDDFAIWGSALGGLATAIAVFAATWAYLQERNRHRASVLLDAFSKFYDDDDKRAVRSQLESFGEPDLRLIARKAIDSPLPLTHDESVLCGKLDEYLNYFQFIGWLYKHGDLDVESVTAMFRYFLANLRHERNGWLLDYMRHFGYEPLIEFLQKWSPDSEKTRTGDGETTLVFAYGTLRKGGGVGEGRAILGNAEPIARATVQGTLYWVAGEEFPALKDSWREDVVVGELYEVTAQQLTQLDEYEGYERKPTDLFVRRRREVSASNRSRKPAWVYIWNGGSEGLAHIASGDWVQHRRTKATSGG